ncbi:MAG: beta-ketoacyl synthase N-terminal-like domain-containing protein, partial [Sphingomonadales bacterium]
MAEAFVCDAARTPIGRYGGVLAAVRADDLAAHAIGSLLERLVCRSGDFDPGAVEDVFLGCVNQAGEDNRNVARMALLLAGLPVTVPGVTINRLCASGADAVGTAARAINAGQMELAIAGGIECMSRAPFVMGKAEQAWARSARIEDTTMGWRFVNRALDDLYGTETMPQTAE